MKNRPKLSHHSLIDLMPGQKCHLIVLMISQSLRGLLQERWMVFFRRGKPSSLFSSNAAGVLRIIRGQCDCIVQQIQNLRPSHLHLHYITEYLFIGRCHSELNDRWSWCFLLKEEQNQYNPQGFHSAKWWSCMRKTTKEHWWAKIGNSKKKKNSLLVTE